MRKEVNMFQEAKNHENHENILNSDKTSKFDPTRYNAQKLEAKKTGHPVESRKEAPDDQQQKSTETVTCLGLHEELHKKLMEVSLQLKEMSNVNATMEENKNIESINNLINNSELSSIDEHEEECESITKIIPEKNKEISEIKKKIEEDKSSKESEKEQVARRYSNVTDPHDREEYIEEKIREIEDKYEKQQELNNHKKYLLEQEKWIFEKEKSIHEQVCGILSETQMHLYRWKENPEETLQNLGHLSREFQLLQETHLGILQKHRGVLQNLHNTHNDLERDTLSAEERLGLARSYKAARERSNILQIRLDVRQDLYRIQKKLKHPHHLSPEEHAESKERSEFMQKCCDIAQDLDQIEHKLTRTDLSSEERVNLESTHYRQSDHLIWLRQWNKALVGQTEPNLSPETRERLEIRGTMCKWSCKFIEKIQNALDMQNRSNISEVEKAVWKHIYKLESNNIYIQQQRRKFNHLASFEELRAGNESWDKTFKTQERVFNALEKYSEVQEKLQHTQDELTRTNLSRAERANLQESHWILQAWKKNLDRQVNSGWDSFLSSMALKLSEALEKSYSGLTDSDLPPKERTKQKTSRWILKKWHKNLDKYIRTTFSVDKHTKCKNTEKLYDAWETGETTAIRRQLIILQRKATQYQKSFVNTYWKMLCRHP